MKNIISFIFAAVFGAVFLSACGGGGGGSAAPAAPSTELFLSTYGERNDRDTQQALALVNTELNRGRNAAAGEGITIAFLPMMFPPLPVFQPDKPIRWLMAHRRGIDLP
ncbi:MAG: hypothetical protein HAW59_05490 [Betaproteobacteria bacterium]|nr:hypothetical protein [Betaproteobacteria bacterium]